MKRKKKARDRGPEKQIETSILHYLNMLPQVFAWKANVTGIYDPQKNVYRSLKGFAIKGVSDILGLIHPSGRMIALEVKTPARRSKLTLDQKYFLDHIKQYGGVAGVVTSLHDAEELMKGVLDGEN